MINITPQKQSAIRTIYLYLFALVGLGLMVVGSVRFLDMGLKMFVFTKAEDPEKIQMRYYPSYPYPIEKLELYQDTQDLTEEEITNLKNFLSEYQTWKEREEKVDYLASQRQKNASNNLAMILIGLPLYLYHWRIIKKEVSEKV